VKLPFWFLVTFLEPALEDTMRKRGLIILISIISLSVVAMWQSRFWSRKQNHVRYTSTKGDSPIEITMDFTSPTRDLASVRETAISQQFRPGDLLSIGGPLVLGPNKAVPPVLVEIIEHRGANQGDVVMNSAVEVPQGDIKNFSIRINAPARAGEYEVIVKLGGGNNYVGRGKIIVRSE
jgi:hypothetical protein